VRIVTLGSDRRHPLTLAALAVVDELEDVEHVDHVTANDAREFLRDPRSFEYRMHLAALEPDLLISAAYARIVPEDVLAIPKLGAINIHPSLLPAYRGVSAVWWALYDGCSQVGVTIHEMTVRVDTGPILAQVPLEVSPDADPVSVGRALGELAEPLLKETLARIRESGRVTGTPQPEGGSYRSQPQTEARRLEIDWSQTADELVRRDRIFPGQGNIPAARWRIYAVRIDSDGPTERPPGSVLRRRPKSILVAAGDGSSVQLLLARPIRAWAKFLLYHASTGNFRTLRNSSPRGATSRAAKRGAED
jgi:methionyl-tRNA formyltransferase